MQQGLVHSNKYNPKIGAKKVRQDPRKSNLANSSGSKSFKGNKNAKKWGKNFKILLLN